VRFLFVHQNFPGQYIHILRQLIANPEHDVVFLTAPNDNAMPGVRKVEYRLLRASTPGLHPDAVELETASIRAESVAARARDLARLGFKPDVIVGHNGWGELLHLPDIWRDVPILPYFEFYYHDVGLDIDFDPEFPVRDSFRSTIRARNAVNLLGLQIASVGQTPTAFQRDTYPDWARERITLVPEGVDLNTCRPREDAVFRLPGTQRSWSRGGRPLVTYVARNLEPYRGFHTVIRALPQILAARPDVEVVLVGGDSVSYGQPPDAGTWREHFLRELGGGLPLDRVHFTGKIPYRDYLSLLAVSTVHVYLTYPFVASWSLREALAVGCAIVGSDVAPVREFITPGENGVLVPALDPGGVAGAVLELLEDRDKRQRLSERARRFAISELGLASHIGAFHKALTRATS
jgi:glycosyltransferase involved in cell wall biosynthesis